LAIIFELAKELRKEGNLLIHQGKTETPTKKLYQDWIILKELAQVLGLEAKLEIQNQKQTLTDEEIESLIAQRTAARNNKNYAEGDRIRNELQEKGIFLVDQGGGITRWHRE
jgi:cysteinyl-tRNA synthetase